jgi:hypothetical protein
MEALLVNDPLLRLLLETTRLRGSIDFRVRLTHVGATLRSDALELVVHQLQVVTDDKFKLGFVRIIQYNLVVLRIQNSGFVGCRNHLVLVIATQQPQLD